MKIIVLAKTNLNFDGRILSHLDALTECFPKANILFLLIPDGKTNVHLPPSIQLKEVNFILRKLFSKSVILQFVTAFVFAIYQIATILKHKPKIITVNDLSAALGPVILSFFTRLNIVYDDHELFERPTKAVEYFWFYVEKRIVKIANCIIVANKERAKILSYIFKPKCKIVVVTNHPYNKKSSYNNAINKTLREIKKKNKIILHQGRIFNERGSQEIKQIITQLPHDWCFCAIGVPKIEFDALFDEGNYDKSKFVNLGYVNYDQVQSIWNEVDASIIIYKPNFINNRYCAPNRLFFALSTGIPIIVNRENPVLSEVINKNKNGISIKEDKVCVSSFFENYNKYKEYANLSVSKHTGQENKDNISRIYSLLLTSHYNKQ
jgi:glycosyltransferase involved in cell wall biosynthesis